MLSCEDHAIDVSRSLVGEYEQFLSGKAQGTREAYLRTVRHLIGWVTQLPSHEGSFEPRQLTQTVVESYLMHLEQEGLSLTHRTRVKSTISNFAQFLIEEKGLLQRNPTRGIELPPVPLHVPCQLSHEQRAILCSLVEQADDRRGAALFALGYWAGCRVSDVSWLQMAHTQVGPQMGKLHVGAKGSKGRDIELLNKARQPLYAYLQATGDATRKYVFRSQRSERLTEEGIHYWFRSLKARASEVQWMVIQDLTFHDLRHDFAFRAREAGWSLEKIAHYLGSASLTGVPALSTIGPSPQLSQ
jgi:site-specific recombinase XerD